MDRTGLLRFVSCDDRDEVCELIVVVRRTVQARLFKIGNVVQRVMPFLDPSTLLSAETERPSPGVSRVPLLS